MYPGESFKNSQNENYTFYLLNSYANDVAYFFSEFLFKKLTLLSYHL